MPLAAPGRASPRVTKFTNCRLLQGKQLVERDLWIDSQSGKILNDQEAFYERHLSPDQIVDLDGRILAPGFIDAQLNGAQGFDFSIPQSTRQEYERGLRRASRALARTGVTSYLPTVVSSTPDVYGKILPSLGPSGHRRAEDGAESLGAHLEGPFINPARNGIHKPDVLRACSRGFQDLGSCYGVENMPVLGSEEDREKTDRNAAVDGADSSRGTTVKMITAAPEVGEMLSNIREIRSCGIIYSIGHSDATYEQALAAVGEGATMITHLFNAMRPFSHRDPGIFGLLGQREHPRPFFGVIADGIHLHPTSVQIAFHAHSDGLILVTDAMWLCGLPDGEYEWTNDERIVKTGPLLTLAGSDKIAGSSTTLIACVNNFRRWTGATTAEAINAVTATPARMLGLEGIKGSLQGDADADLVVLGETIDAENGPNLMVKQVWKFGVKIFDTEKHGNGSVAWYEA
ncbi:hypothetical protein Egran_05064 [Elaphomyces granulatus]|uniref:N-acetylglucosamine-6-phosphate deacetylase n=1 Tax=Elaphomyces granulatus TaxID=519963 RepID=A0A232LSM4_9EURO|nr:hypothetical protein Egran_05064 [Elaphomyces granulatus]